MNDDCQDFVFISINSTTFLPRTLLWYGNYNSVDIFIMVTNLNTLMCLSHPVNSVDSWNDSL